MTEKAMLLTLFVSGGLLLALLSIPLIRQRVPPNAWYGFRVRRTLDDPTIWYAVNAYAGKRLFGIGVLAVVVAIGLYRAPGIALDLYAILYAVIFLSFLTLGLVQSFRYLHTFDQA